jgi:hypothetical protein
MPFGTSEDVDGSEKRTKKKMISVPVIVLLSLACSSFILSAFFLWQEIGEINRKLPDREQISYWGMHPMKMAKVKSEYKGLYPSGKIDLMRRLFQYVGFAFMVLLLIPLGFFK